MNGKVKRIHTVLYLLNFCIVALFSFIIYFTTYKICDDWKAREFLELAKYLPHVPWKIPFYNIMSFLLIGVSNLAKRHLFRDKPWQQLVLHLLDLVLCCLITFNMNFSYKGFFLFLMASVFMYMPNIPIRLGTLILTMICFILFDYDLLTVRIHMVSFQDFINYYAPSTRISLFSFRTGLDSINLILIILFFYLLIQSKIRENREYIALNNRLSEKLTELEVANGKLEEATRMKERNRLAQEVHDILGHSLTCISTGLEACLGFVGPEAGKLSTQLHRILEISNKGLRDIRRSVRELKADSVGRLTLVRAIEELTADINGMGNVRVELSIEGSPTALHDDEKQSAYRIVQESLTNSLRHGEATLIRVALRFTDQALAIHVEDNGKGCREIRRNFGLSYMEERAALLGGTLAVASGPEAGFSTRAELPLRRKQSD